MSVVFDEILAEVNAPSTEAVEGGDSSTGEGDSVAAPALADLANTFERLKKRQHRLFAD